MKTIAADFTDGTGIYGKIENELTKLEVGILVNNVGMVVASEFCAIKDENSLNQIVNCNVVSMLRMCHIVLPQMIKRKRGIVINVGSIASVLPTPLIAVYGATKVNSLVLKKYCTFQHRLKS